MNENKHRLRQRCEQIRQCYERAGGNHDQDEHDGAKAVLVEGLNALISLLWLSRPPVKS